MAMTVDQRPLTAVVLRRADVVAKFLIFYRRDAEYAESEYFLVKISFLGARSLS
jgi:hypothetical protein